MKWIVAPVVGFAVTSMAELASDCSGGASFKSCAGSGQLLSCSCSSGLAQPKPQATG
jgi:hypothetical protein